MNYSKPKEAPKDATVEVNDKAAYDQYGAEMQPNPARVHHQYLGSLEEKSIEMLVSLYQK